MARPRTPAYDAAATASSPTHRVSIQTGVIVMVQVEDVCSSKLYRCTQR